MVRNLSLNFLYNKSGSRFETEPESVELVIALAAAEAQRTGNARILSLSKIAIPFWIVQTSPTKSIVLSGPSSSKTQFQFSELKGVGEIRRILTSGVSQPEDVPVIATRIQPIIEEHDTTVVDIGNIVNPSSFVLIEKFIRVAEPNENPNRIELQIDSNQALKRSEEYKEISESAKTRIDTVEDLQKLITEKLGEQFNILENLSAIEIERWNDRIKTMEERTSQEIQNLTKEKDDKLYNLREKHKMNLRAMTADFSRNVNDLEQFYMDIIEKIRDARTEIGQKEDDIEGAISIYSNLENNMRSVIERSSQPFQKLETRTSELQNKAAQAHKEVQEKTEEIERSLTSEIMKRNERLEQSKKEREEKLQEIDELKIKVSSSKGKVENVIEGKILKLKEEFLNVVSWTIENDTIPELAPLTLLDAYFYVSKYDNGSYQIITPSLMPEGGLSINTRAYPLQKEFHEEMRILLDKWIKSGQSFKETFDNACLKGNMLLTTDSELLLTEGLNNLLRRHLLQNDDKERFTSLWKKYAGRCPKCSSVVETGARFCQKCGLDLS